MLTGAFTSRRDSFSLLVEIEASPEEIVAVVGPNGAGKSTLLRTLAGLHPIEAGHVRVDRETWEDAAAGVRLPAEHRSVGYVPQSGLLFPHLTALENVAFGVGGDEAAAQEALERLELGPYAAAMPESLSGGQTQLVAFARALVRQPVLLLLDEPMASVDVAHRSAIRRLIRRELRDRRGYRLLVTHDPVEAAALADRVVVMEGGRITQVGTLDDLRTHPRSRYAAELVGLNFFRGQAVGGVVTAEGGGTLISAAAPDGPVLVTVHPRAVSVYSSQPSGSPRNVWHCTIAAIEPSLDQVRIHLTGPIDLIAEVTPAGASPFVENQPVWVSVKASEVTTYEG
ncbi:MAG: ABC transporter ATP-binding protein [Acidimicrobiia bacterium]|nr:ABC transporter ATP-binding protein [Acidimicrobiia bacterium]